MHIFVGNLSFAATKEDVAKLFGTFGTVGSVSIKKKSGVNSRGFGFVEMPDHIQAEAAITGLEGKEFMGRALSVSLRRPIIVKPKKNYKEIKRLKREAVITGSQPIVIADNVPEVKAKPKKRGPYAGRQGPSTWKKRKGTGKSSSWKKKPGGVKKKFKT